jgi:hypothetical protein
VDAAGRWPKRTVHWTGKTVFHRGDDSDFDGIRQLELHQH